MDYFKSFLEKVLGAVIDLSLFSDANSTTCMIVYQPKVPVELKKYSAFENK